MREIQKPLREAYMSALSSIEVDSISIPVYDSRAAKNAPDHYMIIDNQTDNEIRVKGVFKHDAFITVDIVTQFKPDSGGKELSERIADEVLQIIRPMNGNIDIGSGFQIVNSEKDGSKSLDEHLPAKSIYREILIFKHRIIQI